MKDKLKKIFKVWTSWYVLPIFLVTVFFMPEIIGFIDPTGFVIHNDYFQTIVYAILILCVISEFSYFGILINQPRLWKKYLKEFEEDSVSGGTESLKYHWLLFAYWVAGIAAQIWILKILTSSPLQQL